VLGKKVTFKPNSRTSNNSNNIINELLMVESDLSSFEAHTLHNNYYDVEYVDHDYINGIYITSIDNKKFIVQNETQSYIDEKHKTITRDCGRGVRSVDFIQKGTILIFETLLHIGNSWYVHLHIL
jgi:hypothetical protein